NDALRSLGGVGEVGATDQVGVAFEPSDKRIAFAEFDFRRLGEAAQSGAQAIAVAWPDRRENTHARYARSVSHSFDHAGEKCIHIFEPPKDARKAQQRKRWRWRTVAFGCRLGVMDGLRERNDCGYLAQIPIFFQYSQVIERPPNQG